jgi:hypothetical protein
MTWRATLLRLAVAAVALLPGAAGAQTLYAASLRSFANAGGQIVVGNLFSINLGNGATTLLAPIRLEDGTAVGITGLAAHPGTGTFYAITSRQSPDYPHSLVQIDPTSGSAKQIGILKLRGSDIAFGPGGTLYIWIPATRQLGVVNTTNGEVVALGASGPQTTEGGLAIDDKGIAYITPGGASGTLDTVDLKTGAITPGPPLTGAPFTSINAMTFTPSGLLLAVNSNAGSPALTRLVQINTSTGAVAPLASLPDDTDAIAFGPARSIDFFAVMETMGGRVLAAIALAIGSAIALLGVALWSWRKRRNGAKP